MSVFLIAIIGMSFVQRINPIRQWESKPEKYLVHGDPMLSNLDGYFYLNAAQEILQGTYSTTETYRAYPDTIKRSALPPLLSVLLAGASRVSGVSLNWMGIFLPCIFSLLISIPIYLLARRWCGPATAVMAVALSLLSPYYASRNSLGVLDTDCLNAMFALNAVYLAIKFAENEEKKRLMWALASLLNYGIFLWWWDQTFTAPTILGLGPLGLTVLLHYRPSRREGLVVAGLGMAGLVVIGLVFGFDFYTNFLRSVWNSLEYISKQKTDLYPNVGESISEQKRMSLGVLAAYTIFVPTCFHLALMGFFWLFARAKKEMLLCLPLFIVASFTVFFAQRFAIFAVPVVALGFTAFIFLTAQLFRRRSARVSQLIFAVGVAYCLYAGFAFYKTGTHRSSIYPAGTVAGMRELQTLTEKDAVIWNWWDEGHSLVYWAQRKTIGDGMIHGGQRNHCMAFPYTVRNDRLAANFIQFYLTQGLNGLNRFYDQTKTLNLDGETLLPTLLAAGPEGARKQLFAVPEATREQWLADLFPPPSRPVYLFISERMSRTIYWIFLNGTWNTKQQTATKHLPFYHITLPENTELTGLPHFETFNLDPLTLRLTMPQMFKTPTPLQKAVFTDAQGSKIYKAPQWYTGDIRPDFVNQEHPGERYAPSGDYQLDIFAPEKKVIVQDALAAESVLNRLFWRKGAYDSRYFQPVKLDTPNFQVWKVTGDRR